MLFELCAKADTDESFPFSEECRNCDFFEEAHTEARDGLCHRYPPILNVSRWDFPCVRYKTSCGEFKLHWELQEVQDEIGSARP